MLKTQKQTFLKNVQNIFLFFLFPENQDNRSSQVQDPKILLVVNLSVQSFVILTNNKQTKIIDHHLGGR